MITKVLKTMLMAILVVCAVLPGYAEGSSSGNSDAPVNGGAVLDLQAPHPKTKRMPSKNVLEVVYTDGILTLDSNFYEGIFSLSFKNYESGEIYEVPTIQVGQSVPFELVIGEYEVKAIGEDGSLLSGFMQVY